jgi:hypothetical protein
MLDERAQRERLEERETTTITIALTTSPTNKPPTRRDAGGGPGHSTTPRACNNITPQFEFCDLLHADPSDQVLLVVGEKARFSSAVQKVVHDVVDGARSQQRGTLG